MWAGGPICACSFSSEEPAPVFVLEPFTRLRLLSDPHPHSGAGFLLEAIWKAKPGVLRAAWESAEGGRGLSGVRVGGISVTGLFCSTAQP